MTAGWRSEARARLDAAAPGPWEARLVEGGPLDSDSCAWEIEPDVVEVGQDFTFDSVVGGIEDVGNADFIAHAPSDLRRALDALDAVLALHAPESEYGGTVCSHCIVEVDCGYPDGEVPSPAAWPCPTVRAIQGTEA